MPEPAFAMSGCPSFTLKEVDAVAIEGSKSLWIPTTCIVENTKYIKISKWDRGFCKFATGQTMERRSGKTSNSVNYQCLDSLLKLRRQACNSALRKALAEAEACEERPTMSLRGKKKETQARESDRAIAGHSVYLDTPETQRTASVRMQVLWSVQSPDLWVEHTQVNLEYLRSCIMDEKEAQALGRTRKRKAGETQDSPDESQNVEDSQDPEEQVAEPPAVEESHGSD